VAFDLRADTLNIDAQQTRPPGDLSQLNQLGLGHALGAIDAHCSDMEGGMITDEPEEPPPE
jgi:hypothetical protein